jgi:hypothetical protein
MTSQPTPQRTPQPTPPPSTPIGPRRSLRLLLGALVALIVAPFAMPSNASAHVGNQSYVYLEIFDTAIAGRVEVPIIDLNRVLDLDIEPTADDALDQVEANLPAIHGYLFDHLSLGPADGASTWQYTFGETNVLDLGGGSYAVFEFEVDQRFDPPPRTFTVSYDAIIEFDADRDGLLLIATDWGSGTFNNEASSFLRFDRGNPTELVDLDDTSWWKGMAGVIELGAEHIRIGTDHILFVFALVLPSVLAFAKGPDDTTSRWYPSAGFRSTLWRVLKIVTMFTVAHSITLALGGLEIVELSPRLVETIIAISIAAAALHNIHPVFVNKEWALAFGFGLFHGFGFAGLLTELGLDRSNRIPSLLGFNVGVELGQAAIILMTFPMLFIVRRTRYYLGFMYTGSVVLATVSLAWATERIFEYDLRVNEIVDPVLRWPRSAILVVTGYAIATAVWRWEKSRDRLLDAVDRSVADDDDDDTVIDDDPLLVNA